jgi:trans-aconitate methyltransferase
MVSRPEAWGAQHAARFQEQSVVDRYHLRPPYPPEVFTLLNDLLVDEPRVVLDAGCGLGDIARYLLDRVERIDAVDISQPMLNRARTLPGGDSPKIRWLHGRIEDIELRPPYALITAGRSLHWMDWQIVLPRFAQLLTGRGMLAIIGSSEEGEPWREEVDALAESYSVAPQFWGTDLIALLEEQQLFRTIGNYKTSPMEQLQTITDFIAALHSRSGLSLEALGAERSARLDAEVRQLLAPYEQNGQIVVLAVGHVTWGRPLAGKASAR